MHNLQATGHIRTFYEVNECSTIGDVYFLGQSCMWDVIDKLWLEICITVSFNKPFVRTYTHNLKLHITYGCSACWTTALLLEIFLVWFRGAWQIWLESYSPKHTSVILCYNIVVYILQACTYIAIWCATIHDNKTHTPYDCILYTKWRLYYQQCITFIRKNFTSYTTCCGVFLINHVY